jgi:DNA mismatch repair protein MutS
MSMINEYIEYQQKYEKLYGDNTIVLYQNGSFFEIFGIDNDIEKIGCPKEISETLNIILTRKNKIIKENRFDLKIFTNIIK